MYKIAYYEVKPSVLFTASIFYSPYLLINFLSYLPFYTKMTFLKYVCDVHPSFFLLLCTTRTRNSPHLLNNFFGCLPFYSLEMM